MHVFTFAPSLLCTNAEYWFVLPETLLNQVRKGDLIFLSTKAVIRII